MKRRILWCNIPARAWLWLHGWHGYQNLAGETWWCQCGSEIKAAKR